VANGAIGERIVETTRGGERERLGDEEIADAVANGRFASESPRRRAAANDKSKKAEARENAFRLFRST
jgi:hypothetical protein